METQCEGQEQDQKRENRRTKRESSSRMKREEKTN